MYLANVNDWYAVDEDGDPGGGKFLRLPSSLRHGALFLRHWWDALKKEIGAI